MAGTGNMYTMLISNDNYILCLSSIVAQRHQYVLQYNSTDTKMIE